MEFLYFFVYFRLIRTFKLLVQDSNKLYVLVRTVEYTPIYNSCTALELHLPLIHTQNNNS